MRRKASIAFLKGFFYLDKGEFDLSLQLTMEALTLQEELGYKQDIARSLTQLGIIYLYKGEIERAQGYYERGLVLEKNGFNRNKPHLYLGIQVILSYHGDLEGTMEYAKRGLAFAEELNDKYSIPLFLNNIGITYYQKNDLIRALSYFERSLIGFEKRNNVSMIIFVLDSLFDLAIYINSYDRAQQYFNRMGLFIDQEKSKLNDVIYRLDKILMLKISTKASDRMKAKELLQQFVDEEIVWWDVTINALLHLCDTLLVELRITNDLKVVDELQSYITRILDIAENQNINHFLAETYLLQSKMYLLILDLKKAQRSLTQAQHICEKYGYDRFAIRVSSEQEELSKQLSVWDNLKQSRISINKRMDFARLDEQLLRMFHLRFFLKKQISTP
ncbi:MAG: tetratricopeptide repeat protein [Promethearchaeia archaeon]